MAGSGMLMSPTSTFITDFVQDFIRMDKPRTGGTKAEATRNLVEFNGKQDGLAMGLAYYGNELRREKVRRLNLPKEGRHNWVPALTSMDFTRWMHELRLRWTDGEWKEVSDTDFFAKVTEEFLAIVFDEDWDTYYKAVRKDAVKAGLLDPTPEDQEWITEELEAYRAMAGPLEKLAEKLNK